MKSFSSTFLLIQLAEKEASNMGPVVDVGQGADEQQHQADTANLRQLGHGLERDLCVCVWIKSDKIFRNKKQKPPK